jgi:hypothetical protein
VPLMSYDSWKTTDKDREKAEAEWEAYEQYVSLTLNVEEVASYFVDYLRDGGCPVPYGKEGKLAGGIEAWLDKLDTRELAEVGIWCELVETLDSWRWRAKQEEDDRPF